jgi:2-polyprenyl-3-methyl-5-hydroxy-6-metoxy-1,4-benzoquinol methylase
MDRGKSDVGESVSDGVAHFYDHYGWADQGGGGSGEDQLFRRFRPAHAEYTSRSADRTVALLAERCGSLLIAGCGDMPESHVRIAAGFHRVTCMDISAAALRIAERKLGTAASYRRESIVDTALQDSLFDAVFCAHVIYHIDEDEQEAAVRQLVRVTRPGGRIVIIYANPRSPFVIPGAIMRTIKRRIGARRGGYVSGPPTLYYHGHPLRWWRRFTVECDVAFIPWEVIGSRPARALLWGDRMAAAFFNAAAWFETKAPHAAVRLWQVPIVVLDKKARTSG